MITCQQPAAITVASSGGPCTHPNPISSLSWFTQFGPPITGGDLNLSASYINNPLSVIATLQPSDEDYLVTINVNYTLWVYEDSSPSVPVQMSSVTLYVGGAQVATDSLTQVDNSNTCESKSGTFNYSFTQHAAGPSTTIQLKQDGVSGELSVPCAQNTYVMTLRPLCPP